ncbi:PepSY-associated TM helix domain-containing protein [Aureivirga sp. CE67]|uniref:PepSY-associated TM helix domain-containing protein n=1 Tax=Aureivirga sp. CE67 TaxID=1788983 RepID=UPI0018C9D593|nr:PepSY-associated TM helix domain-containing protein [Aureivirga sp. CE67]
MKLKSLSKRSYNILFHTHTVSGIVISFALFIIFFAGSFSLFKDEIYTWENPEARFEIPKEIDFPQILDAVEKEYPSVDLNKEFTLSYPTKKYPFVYFYGKSEENEGIYAGVHPISYEITDHDKAKTTVAETIYELHYFDQIPTLGLYLSGFVAFFFLFATITGICIHWKNILAKFSDFSTKGKLKQVWTKSHTVLGVIGIPFQIIYATTGAVFGLLNLLLLPSALVLFDGKTEPIFENIEPEHSIVLNEEAKEMDYSGKILPILNSVQNEYKDFEVRKINLHHYKKEDGFITVTLDDHEGIVGDGNITKSLKTEEVLTSIIPYEKEYSQAVYNSIIKLHFANYGGFFLKIIYFILAIMTCVVISSGVLIWQKARQNNRYTEAQQVFHKKVTKSYLTITSSLLPAIAILFLANKFVPFTLEGRTFIVNSIFFGGWLLLSLLAYFEKQEKIFSNRLMLTAIFALLIPIANGIITGDWIWTAFSKGLIFVASVDLFWIFLFGVILLILKLKRTK